jgi:hypothetical protein
MYKAVTTGNYSPSPNASPQASPAGDVLEF